MLADSIIPDARDLALPCYTLVILGCGVGILVCFWLADYLRDKK